MTNKDSTSGGTTRSDTLADASVAVVIVNFRTPELTRACLASLKGEKALLPKLKVIVVDGGSADGSAAALAATIAKRDYRNWVRFLPLDLNGGFAWANNQAILTLARETSPPEFVHLLNPDTQVTANAVVHLAEELRAHPHCGAAGSQLLTESGEPAASAFRFPSAAGEFLGAVQSDRVRRLLGIVPTVVRSKASCEADWVTGASVMFRAEALRETGLFDDGFFLYYEEVELMRRLRDRGWTVRHVPQSQVVHVEAAATGITAARAMPNYWYDSRRRYFALTSGRSALMRANLGWLAGRTIAAAKIALGGRKAPIGVRARDLFRLSKPNDERRSVPELGDAPGKPPAWMSRS